MPKCTKRLIPLLLAAAMLFSIMSTAFPAAAEDSAVPSYTQVYESMIALKEAYPEGMTWTNYAPYGDSGELGPAYTWKGGPVYGANSGVGCMAFAFILSDKAFGSLPARAISPVSFDSVQVGDILRVNGNSHSVIVLQKSQAGVTVAEANYNKSVHWGRVLTAAEVEAADFLITRYPEGYVSPDAGDADDVDQSGTADGMSWTLTKGGVLTVSGSSIPDYSPNDGTAPPWKDLTYNTIVIEKGITRVGAYAFYESKALAVYIPEGVTGIGQSAFYGSGLIAVTIPGTVRTIGDDAFRNCMQLTSATVSDGVTTIGERAFYSCGVLKHIDFPASVTSIGAGAFTNCVEITSVRFMPGTAAVTVGDNLFTECQRLTSVTLPQTIDRISSGMFSGCISLARLYIPAGVTGIFEVGSTGGSPFSQCRSLSVIDFGGSEADWTAKGGAHALTYSGLSDKVTVNFSAAFDDPFADDGGSSAPSATARPAPTAEPGATVKPTATAGPTATAEPTAAPAPTIAPPPIMTPAPVGTPTPSQKPVEPTDGPVIDTTIDEETGSRTETATYPDGSTIVTVTQTDGTVSTVTTGADGSTQARVVLSSQAISAAEHEGRPVALPIPEVTAVQDADAAPAITIITESEEPAAVAVPAVSPTAGTVAVIVLDSGATRVIKTSVRAGSSIIAPVSSGASIKIIENGRSFADVSGASWYAGAVEFVSARELFSGTGPDTFSPKATMSRAMLMTVIANFDGADVSGGDVWYSKSVEWAIEHGVSDGSNPNGAVTREQMVSMLWRYMGSPSAGNSLSGYLDTGSISGYAREAMAWAVENGIVSGVGGGLLDPQGTATRAQAAMVLENLIENMALSTI